MAKPTLNYGQKTRTGKKMNKIYSGTLYEKERRMTAHMVQFEMNQSNIYTKSIKTCVHCV